MSSTPEAVLIIEYANLLHDHPDLDDPVVKAFVEKHKDDEVLQRRIIVINTVFELARETKLKVYIEEAP